MKHTLKIAVLALAAVLTACGGSHSKTMQPGAPLDPQGNWLFTFTGSSGSVQLEFAGQLF
jgi:hypothetical protein